MCEPTAILMAGNAGLGMQSANASANFKARQAKMDAAFVQGQMENMSILAEAKALRQQRDMTQQYTQGIMANVAAGVLSGLSMESFASVEKGAMKMKRQAMGDLQSNLTVEKSNLKMRGIMAKLGGDMEAAAAKMQGTMQQTQIFMDTATDFSRGFKGFEKGKPLFDWSRSTD